MATITSGLVGGLIATIIMSIVMRATGGGPPPTANLVAKYRGGDPGDHLMPGMILHLLYGTIAGGVLVPLVSAAGLGISSLAAWTAAGVVYGIVLLVGGAIVWIRGVLGIDPDQEMLMRFVGVHLVYGLVLGAVIGYGLVG